MKHLVHMIFLACLSVSSALYESTSDVITLTDDNFDSLVLKSDQIWLVEFFAPWCGHCKNLVPAYKDAARALKGLAKVGAVDGDANGSMAQKYKVSGFPTIMIISNGKHQVYNGGRTADALVDAVLKAAKDSAYQKLGKKSGGGDGTSAVVELTDSNFKEKVLDSDDIWLVEFFAPWCGHCKNLEPQWAKAASELKGKVKLGALDATVHAATAQRYHVQGYPTIKYFPAGAKTADSAVDYNGGRTAGDIVAYAMERLAESIPAPEVLQVTSEAVLRACSESPLCVVSVLPHILDCDAACRSQYLATLAALADKYKSKMWGWVWSEAGQQPALEEALELGGFGYPAMAVVSAKKLKFSTLRGSFSKEGINEFLRDLSFGRGQTAPVRGAEMPKVSTIEPWDGKDGQLPPEEDLDLSDVDLEKDEL